jgi:ferredoxin
MKANVNADLCTGCELCVGTCPEVFEMAGDIAKVVAAPVPPDAEATCQEAADDCPVEAISIE